MTMKRSMEEILHIIELTGEFNMCTKLYNITVHVDGDKLIIYPGKQDPTWEGWRNFELPELEVDHSGQVVSIHDNMPGYEDGILRLKLDASDDASYFVPINRYNWQINFFRDYAEIIKAYIINLAAMWAAYNKEMNV